MNNSRIKIFLDELLAEYEQTSALLEQKEELMIHLTERVQDHMANGRTYDEAFDATIRDMGDVKALVTGIAPKKTAAHHEALYNDEHKQGRTKSRRAKNIAQRIAVPLSSMSVFIYLLVGIAFGWWAWAWVIIPMAGTLNTGNWRVMLCSWSVFIYFLLGWFCGWWAWGWLIIPLSGCVFTTQRGHW